MTTGRGGNTFERFDTQIRGGQREFVTTRWSRLLASNPEGRTQALRYFADNYWKAIYSFLRAGLRCSNEEAKELTQEFFLWIAESNYLQKVDSAGGRFRALLKTTLRHFVSNVRRDARRHKRGGRAVFLSWEQMDDQGLEPGSDTADPDAALDKQWKESILSQARQNLLAWSKENDKESWVKLWADYDMADTDAHIDHATLAERYGITRREVVHQLTVIRTRFREMVMSVVLQTVGDPKSLKEEIVNLFGTSPA